VLSVWWLLRSYNAQYAARLDGWEAARTRELATHAAKAQRAFSGAGGEALAQQLLDRVLFTYCRTLQRPAGWQGPCMESAWCASLHLQGSVTAACKICACMHMQG